MVLWGFVPNPLQSFLRSQLIFDMPSASINVRTLSCNYQPTEKTLLAALLAVSYPLHKSYLVDNCMIASINKNLFSFTNPQFNSQWQTSANWKKRSLKPNMWRQLRTSASIQNSSLLFGLEIIFLSRIGWATHLASGIAVVLFLNQKGMISML